MRKKICFAKFFGSISSTMRMTQKYLRCTQRNCAAFTGPALSDRVLTRNYTFIRSLLVIERGCLPCTGNVQYRRDVNFTFPLKSIVLGFFHNIATGQVLISSGYVVKTLVLKILLALTQIGLESDIAKILQRTENLVTSTRCNMAHFFSSWHIFLHGTFFSFRIYLPNITSIDIKIHCHPIVSRYRGEVQIKNMWQSPHDSIQNIRSTSIDMKPFESPHILLPLHKMDSEVTPLV